MNRWGPKPLTNRKNPGDRMSAKSGWLGRLRFHVRNLIATRTTRICFSLAMWLRIKRRRRRRSDPSWKESWWVLERRYSKLAKMYSKLELRYLKTRGELRRLKNGACGTKVVRQMRGNQSTVDNIYPDDRLSGENNALGPG